MEQSYFLGIDGGGSKCKVRLEDADRNLLGEYVSGPANPSRDFDTAIQSIRAGVEGVFDAAEIEIDLLSQTHAVFGLAGLNVPSCLQKMQSWDHPFKSLILTTDLHIACVGAHQQDSGAIVIIGTGSSGIVYEAGEPVNYGGHGFLLGDKGSGAWFGLQALRYTLESADGIKPASLFTQAVLANLNCKTANEIVDEYLMTPPAKFAQLAPLVFDFADQQDSAALQIVEEGTRYISDMCQQMQLRKPTRLAFIGGLSHKLVPWLPADLQACLSKALNPPEVGAIIIARQQHALGLYPA